MTATTLPPIARRLAERRATEQPQHIPVWLQRSRERVGGLAKDMTGNAR